MPELKSDFKSRREIFPSPLHTLEAGIIALGIPATVETLFEAYSFGIFPWPHEEMPLLWFCPDQRGVLDFDDFHISKRLKRDLRAHAFEYSWNRDFEGVMGNCQSAVRASESGTWITDELIKAYTDFHLAGYAHSIEVWREDEMVGGLYGVCVGGVFSAESMFFKVSPASKAALIFCVESLKEKGLEWIDVQMVSSLSRQFGAKYIRKADFLNRIKKQQTAIYSQS